MNKIERVPEPDPELTESQKLFVEKLTVEELVKIDDALMSNATVHWRKVAMIVGLSIPSNPQHKVGIPDIFYAQRVRGLVESGQLESQGNLSFMRRSEVRLPFIAEN